MEYEALIAEHLQVVQTMQKECLPDIMRFAEACRATLAAGGTVYLMGNGGSAADCQHFAAELVGRFQKERQAMAAVALTTDTSILTALANDYSFDIIYSRQIEALVRPGDLVVGISTSGNSVNILRGFAAAKTKGAKAVGLTGRSGGKMKDVCDICICIPSDVTARIQEAHMLMEHLVCQRIEE